jgi:hypothetical protein
MIKKFFIICALVFMIGVPNAFAQDAPTATCNENTAISSSNYSTCCPSTIPQLSERCNTFHANFCASVPNDPICTGNPSSGNTPNNQCSSINTGNFPQCCPSNNMSSQCTQFIIGLCTSQPNHFLCTSYASGGTQCTATTAVSSSNYRLCCPSNTAGLKERCATFLVNYCASVPSDTLCTGGGTIPQQIGGGGLDTSPVNGGSRSETGIPSDKTGYSNFSSCDAIKLKSLINILIWLKCLIVAVAIPLIFALAFLFFLIGVFKFMTADTPDKKKNGQKLVWWGLIGLFVMVSVWGIIKIVNNTLGIEQAVPFLQTDYLNEKNATP